MERNSHHFFGGYCNVGIRKTRREPGVGCCRIIDVDCSADERHQDLQAHQIQKIGLIDEVFSLEKIE
jgi:hypothetical protein